MVTGNTNNLQKWESKSCTRVGSNPFENIRGKAEQTTIASGPNT